jgi:hypothetical protein
MRPAVWLLTDGDLRAAPVVMSPEPGQSPIHAARMAGASC